MPIAFQDYYEALEVSRDASQDEIHQAYGRLARRSAGAQAGDLYADG
jgi:curved DNA-binding protein CbpA